MSDDGLDERTRAEDILLGSLGLGEDAHIISVKRRPGGYVGRAAWSDGEEFDFESEDELSDLDNWALDIFLSINPK